MGAIRCIKYLLFSFNFVFWLAGMGALGIGIWMYVDPGASLNAFMGKFSFKIPSAILMGAGAIVMLTGFCGCAGAIRESRCLLGSFFFMLLLIFCAETACGILGFLFRGKIEAEMTKETKDIIKTKYGLNDLDITKSVDDIQKKFKCCGAESSKDYDGSKWRATLTLPSQLTRALPKSCCKSGSTCNNQYITVLNDAYAEGCLPQIKKSAEDNMMILAGIAIGVGAIQILGMIFALCLFFSIDN